MLARALKTPVALALLAVLTAGCASRQRLSLPENTIDRAGRVLDVVNTTLNTAVDFYARQALACQQKEPTCRFSPDALDSFRRALIKANDSFIIALAAYEAWRELPSDSALASDATAKIEQAQKDTATMEANCGSPCRTSD